MTLGGDFWCITKFQICQKSWFVLWGGGGLPFWTGLANPPVHCTIVILLKCHLILSVSPREVMYNVKYRLDY